MVKPAFALALYGEFLTLLSRPLGTPDIFSGVYRPSPTTISSVVPLQVSNIVFKGWCSIGAFTIPSETASTLPSTLHIENHIAAPDCGKHPWGLLFPLEVPGIFTGQ
jgi:hypothetical protein